MRKTALTCILALLLSGVSGAPSETTGLAPHTRAQLRAPNTTTLAAGLAGRIDRLPVRLGQALRRGALVASFDCRLEKAERAVAQAKLGAAEAKLEVNRRLAELDNISPLELTLSSAEVDVAKAKLQSAQAKLQPCRVTAPFDGIVTQRPAQPFAYVTKGDPLIELVATDDLGVEMVLPSTWLPRLEPGQRFILRLDEAAQPVTAQIDRVVGRIDPVSQTVRVLGELIDTGGQRLLPGMSGGIEFMDR